MAIQKFKRVEKKYIITLKQKDELLEILKSYMEIDAFCKNGNMYTIENLYFDMGDMSVIRRSLERPRYKEKLRIRKYSGDDRYFLEVKKKLNGIVGKRRILLNKEQAMNFINDQTLPTFSNEVDNHIKKEIEYYLSHHPVKPSTLVKYDRYALFGKDDKSLRITFDLELKSNRKNVEFDKGVYDNYIIPPDLCILEIKTSRNYPLWLAKALSKIKIYPHTFSKYGKDHENSVKEKIGV